MIRYLPALTVLFTLAMSACTVLPESKPPTVVGLAVDDSGLKHKPLTHPLSVRVDLPLASAPFDGNLLLIQPNEWEFQSLPDTRWRAIMPVLVHDQLLQSLRASRGFDHVLAANSAANADITLLPELRGFHARKTGGDTTVIVHLHYELVQNRTRETLCVLDERQEVPTENTGLASLMAAFGQGTGKVAANTADWAFKCLEGVNGD